MGSPGVWVVVAMGGFPGFVWGPLGILEGFPGFVWGLLGILEGFPGFVWVPSRYVLSYFAFFAFRSVN